MQQKLSKKKKQQGAFITRDQLTYKILSTPYFYQHIDLNAWKGPPCIALTYIATRVPKY